MARPVDDNQEHIIEEAAREFVDARWRGEEPDVDEFVRRYPHIKHQLRQRIQDVRNIDALFDSLVQVDESDFENIVTEPDLVGHTIGSFEIIKMIGRGGMGTVYLAHDTKLDRSVAVKSIPAELQASSNAQMRFQREARLLASLNHPNIAVIHEIVEQDESAGYLILEYIPGETLAQRIAREPLKLHEALSIGSQIAEALSAAHVKGVVHRDLKPSNIKITPDGRVKVLDFGLAKVSISEGKDIEATATHPGRIIGTPAYMSPEQARGKKTDHRADIWSFGCIMYQMLSGRLPFEGETATDTLAHIIEREPNWELLLQETPTNIRILLRRCLEKDSQRRLRDIGDAAIEINETLSKSAIASPVTIGAKLRRMAMIIGAVVIGVILSGIALKYIPHKQTQPSSKEIWMVVLPFENLSSDKDEYFAAGITDQITSHLAPIRGLSVISPRTAAQYDKGEKDARQIGKELGADYILGGTVQREQPSDQTKPVRVTVRLVRASENRLILSPIHPIYKGDPYELYQVGSAVAEKVLQALDITMLEPERLALASRLTENMEAYNYYLHGNEYYYRSYLENDVIMAIRMYEKAVELDPLFAQAYARLSEAHLQMYWFNYDHNEQRLAMAKQAVDKAFQLNPDQPEVHNALGWYYYQVHLDYDYALEEFTIVRKSQPNNSDLLFSIGSVQRRQGKFEEALANIKRASELDPLSHNLAWEVGVTFMLLREYEKAEHYLSRAIELAPDRPIPYSWKVKLYLFLEGKTDKARAVLDGASQNMGALEDRFTVLWSVLLDMFDGDYQKALAQLSLWKLEAFNSQFYFIPKAQLYAQINGLMGNQQLEQAYYESARSILRSQIQEDPNDARFRSSLGIAYAGLGRKEEAIREGLLAVELLPVTKEAWRGLYRIEDLARIYVMVGEFDAAIDQLEDLLSRPGEMSIPLLRLDPTWGPLHNHPRFKKLIESDK